MKEMTLAEFLRQNRNRKDEPDKEEIRFLKEKRNVEIQRIMHEYEITDPQTVCDQFGFMLPDVPEEDGSDEDDNTSEEDDE